MKKRVIIALICIVLSLQASAQKANYREASKYMPCHADELIGSKDVQPKFVGDGDNFWFTYKTSDGTNYFYVNPSKKSVEKLFDNAELIAQMSKLSNKSYRQKDISITPKFSKDGKSFTIRVDTFDLTYNLKTKAYSSAPVKKLVMTHADSVHKKNAGNYMHYAFSPDSVYAIYSLKHNLWIKQLKGDDTTAIQLTKNGEKYFSYSYDERGNNDRLFGAKVKWIGKSNKCYSLREDSRKAYKLPIVVTLGGAPKVNEYPYYLPGQKDVMQYHLIIVDVKTKKHIEVDLSKWKDQKITVIQASDKTGKIYVERKKRTCDEIDICAIDIESGKVEVLFNEVCKPYFNEQLQSISFINDCQEILWWSERTGWGQYYMYDGNGKEKRTLTKGEWVAGKVVKIDTVGRKMYIEGNGREKGVNPYYTMLYKVDLDGKKEIELLTPENANHNVVMAKTGDYFIDNYSRIDLAPQSILRNRNGKLVCKLAEADLTRLYAMGWKMPEYVKVKAADGFTDLYGAMWKPHNFDSTKKYPIISYVYPGPQTEATPVNFTVTGVNNTALAQVGFIVISVGHRGGSPIRGKEYHTYGYNNLRDYALADDKYIIEQMADKYNFIDINRVGIYGHSGGGFMSTAALCTYPEFYKVAVSSSGNHNNNIYNRWWSESHHGVTESVKKDKNGKSTSTFTTKVPTNMELAKNLKGHLLLISGDADENVHPANTLQMVHALTEAGKNFDMYILPGQKHKYEGVYDKFYSYKLWYYFAKHLLGDYSAEEFYDIDQFKN